MQDFPETGSRDPEEVCPYVDDVLGDLPGLVDVQHVPPLPDHRVQRQTFTEAAHTNGSGQTPGDHGPGGGGGLTW